MYLAPDVQDFTAIPMYIRWGMAAAAGAIWGGKTTVQLDSSLNPQHSTAGTGGA